MLKGDVILYTVLYATSPTWWQKRETTVAKQNIYMFVHVSQEEVSFCWDF